MSDESKRDAGPVVPHVAIEKQAEPVNLEHLGAVALPPGWTLGDVSSKLGAPLRPSGMASLLSVDSLVRLARRFGSFERSLVMVDLAAEHLVGLRKAQVVVHYDAGMRGAVGWTNWGAVRVLSFTPALTKLMGFIHQGGDHRALVRLLDAMVDYLVEPEAAVIHDAIGKLSLTKEVRFNRAENLQSGDVALMYETVTGASTEAGRVRLPEHLVFQFPVFEGLESEWMLKLRLRYQLKDDGVSFKLESDLLHEKAGEVAAEVLDELEGIFANVAEVVAGTAAA